MVFLLHSYYLQVLTRTDRFSCVCSPTSCFTSLISSCGLLLGSCIQCLVGHTFHDSISNVSDQWKPSRHIHLSNFLYCEHHVLLGRKNDLSSVISKTSIILVGWMWCRSILQLYSLHHFLHLLQFCHQLLMGALRRIFYMLVWFWNNWRIIGCGLLLLQDFFQSCYHIMHHSHVVHSHFLYDDIRCLA